MVICRGWISYLLLRLVFFVFSTLGSVKNTVDLSATLFYYSLKQRRWLPTRTYAQDTSPQLCSCHTTPPSICLSWYLTTGCEPDCFNFTKLTAESKPFNLVENKCPTFGYLVMITLVQMIVHQIVVDSWFFSTHSHFDSHFSKIVFYISAIQKN